MKKALIGLVILAVIAGGAYAIFHKSNKTTNSSNTGTSATTPSASTTPTTPSATSTKIIQTKTDATAGKYLADANGEALYTYGGDTKGVSNCTGSCLSSWPIYSASVTTGLPTNVTVITRTDGGCKQYAYKGLPLYTFTGDSAGTVTGDNVSNFHIAKP